MKLGDRIMRKLDLRGGYIVAARKQSSGVYMVRVRWDEPDETEWLPSEEIRPWDKLQTPPTPKLTPWGRTTPDYLVALRRNLRINAKRPNKQKSQLTVDQLTKQLLSLSDRHKNRSKMKAKKLIKRFNSGQA